MLKEFRDFAVKGNIVDLAVGVIIGGAFGKIVTSLVNDIIMPPIGLVLGRVDFKDLFINLSSTRYATLADARAASAPTLNYGMFINNILDFLIVAFTIFLVLQQLARLRERFHKEKPAAPEPKTKECPYCLSAIPVKATRCGHCTSHLA